MIGPDISGKIGPTRQLIDVQVPMFSFYGPAFDFWQGVNAALLDAGLSEAEAFEALRSKVARWMLDERGEDITELGYKLGQFMADEAKAFVREEL